MKILIIEDEQRLAHILARGLRNNAYEVFISHNGKDGLISVMENNPDVIILDWMLPDISGIEVVQNLRERNLEMPVLMLTAKATLEDKIEGLENGADDYLTKPFEFAELMARVSALGRRPKSIQSNILTTSNLILNSNTKEVIRDGITIYLSAKEFELLEYLMINKGIVKNETEIISAVWDFSEEVQSNKVSVYMRYLRNKIEKPFPKLSPLFQTMRGLGYKILDI